MLLKWDFKGETKRIKNGLVAGTPHFEGNFLTVVIPKQFSKKSRIYILHQIHFVFSTINLHDYKTSSINLDEYKNSNKRILNKTWGLFQLLILLVVIWTWNKKL